MKQAPSIVRSEDESLDQKFEDPDKVIPIEVHDFGANLSMLTSRK